MSVLDTRRAGSTSEVGEARPLVGSSMGPIASWRRAVDTYGLALLSVAAFTGISLAVKPYALLEDEAMIYLLGVLLVALRFDVKVSVFAAVASVLSFDFFFIPPRFAFALSDAKRTLTFLAMIVVAAVVSGLNERLRHQEKLARRTAETRKALYELNVELAAAGQPRQLASATARRLDQLFGASTMILLRTPEGVLEKAPCTLTPEETVLLERAWTRSELNADPDVVGYTIWVPVVGIHEPLGVIGLKATEPLEHRSEQTLLLLAFARELATALERMQLASAVHRSQLEAETERMRSSLLSAVSHDLKTPLANIVAAGTTLLAHRSEIEPKSFDELLSSIVGEGERLSRLVQNLLSITRLESPTIELKQSPEAVEEIVASVLERLRPQLGEREIEVELPSDLPWILAEPALIDQLLSNLLENAMRYTPPKSPISVSAGVVDGGVGIKVADRGPGIPEQEWDRVFEKFYRGSLAPKNDGGLGLGLTICRAIIRAHGGKIAVRGRQGGGTLVEFTLPMARTPHAVAPLADGEDAR